MNSTNEAIFRSAVQLVAAEMGKDSAEWDDARIQNRVTEVFDLLKGTYESITKTLKPKERRRLSTE